MNFELSGRNAALFLFISLVERIFLIAHFFILYYL